MTTLSTRRKVAPRTRGGFLKGMVYRIEITEKAQEALSVYYRTLKIRYPLSRHE